MKRKDLYGANTDASSTATSTEFNLGDLRDMCVGITFPTSAALAGTAKLQASAWDDPGVRHWVDITGSSQAVAAGEDVIWNVAGACYPLMRIVWTPSAGTGTIQGRVGLKIFPTTEGAA